MGETLWTPLRSLSSQENVLFWASASTTSFGQGHNQDTQQSFHSFSPDTRYSQRTEQCSFLLLLGDLYWHRREHWQSQMWRSSRRQNKAPLPPARLPYRLPERHPLGHWEAFLCWLQAQPPAQIEQANIFNWLIITFNKIHLLNFTPENIRIWPLKSDYKSYPN